MKKSEKIMAFTSGFTGYPILELMWRGRTHWSMALAGGLAVLCLYPACRKGSLSGFCCKTAAVITGIELTFGLLFNIILQKNVWDYSQKLWNLWGQICLPYCCLWFLLGIPIRWLCRGLCRACNNLP